MRRGKVEVEAGSEQQYQARFGNLQSQAMGRPTPRARQGVQRHLQGEKFVKQDSSYSKCIHVCSFRRVSTFEVF